MYRSPERLALQSLERLALHSLEGSRSIRWNGSPSILCRSARLSAERLENRLDLGHDGRPPVFALHVVEPLPPQLTRFGRMIEEVVERGRKFDRVPLVQAAIRALPLPPHHLAA